MCIGRSASPNARIAISTATSAPRRPTRRASSPPSAREIAHRAALTPGAQGALDLLRRRHAVADARRRPCGAILDASPSIGRIEPSAEITLEANPTSVEAGRFRGYRARRRQPRLDRRAGAQRRRPARRSAAATASPRRSRRWRRRKAIFPRISFDLIYARVGQSEAAWRAELERAMKLATEHVSLYQLTIEPDTIFERLWQAGKLAHARRGSRPRSVRRDAGDRRDARPAGLRDLQPRPARRGKRGTISSTGAMAIMSASAPARMAASASGGDRRAQATEKHPEMWLGQVEIEGHGLIDDDPLTQEEQSDEYPADGPAPARGHRRRSATRRSAAGALQPQPDRIARRRRLCHRGRRGRMRVTPMGAPLLDTIVADLAA